MRGSDREKLRFVFDVHDEDGDGAIDRTELLRMLHIRTSPEPGLVFGDDMVEMLASSLFETADRNGDGRIDFDEFASALGGYPGVLEHMTLGDLRWLGITDPGATSGPPSPLLHRARAAEVQRRLDHPRGALRGPDARPLRGSLPALPRERRPARDPAGAGLRCSAEPARGADPAADVPPHAHAARPER